MSPSTLALVALAGGVLSMDRTAFVQSMASRPLVAAPLVGLMAGDPAAGVYCGVLLELLWLMRLPVGGSVPPDDTLAAMTAVSFSSSLLEAGFPDSVAASAVGALFAIPFGYAGRRADLAVRRLNGKAYASLRSDLAGGKIPRSGPKHLGGALLFFASGAIFAPVAWWLGWTAGEYAGRAVEPGADYGWAVGVALAVAAVGAGASLSGLDGREGRKAFLVASVAALISLGLLVEG